MDHSPPHDSDDETRENRKDKFKREREGEDDRREQNRDMSSDSRRYSPDRARKNQRYDDSYRGRKDRDSYDQRDNRRYREDSPSDRGRRDSPPGKRRKRDDWDDNRSPSPSRGRDRDDRRRSGGRNQGRPSWATEERDDYFQDRENRDREQDPESVDLFSGARTKASKNIRKNSSLFEGPLKSYKQFLDAQEDNISPSEGEKRYEEYQNEYKRRQLRVFFNEHKQDEWFKEKYDPALLDQKRTIRLATAKQALKNFTEELHKNTIDFNLNAPIDMEASLREASKVSEADQKEEEGELEHAPPEPAKEEVKTEPQPEAMKSDDNGKSEPVVAKVETADNANVLFIKLIPVFISRAEIMEILHNVPGFKKLMISEPNKYKNFSRLGWVAFDSAEACNNALRDLQGKTKIKDFELHLSLNKNPDVRKLPKKLTPPVAAEEARIKIDLEQSKLLCMQLDKEKEIENPILNNPANSSLTPVEQLDRIIIYLRKVHTFCYYCGDEFADEDELTRKCERHLRGAKTETSIEVTTDPWANSLDTKIKDRVHNPPIPSVFNATDRIERKQDKFCNKCTALMEADKHRCTLCNKLFMGEKFVKKHVGLKHADKLEEVKKKAVEQQYFDNYCSDTKRINPGQGLIASYGGRGGRGRGGPQWPNMNMVPNFFPTPPNFFGQPQSYGRGGPRRRGSNNPFNNNKGGYQPRPPRTSMEPPPGVAADPRSMREYRDLDAPDEGTTVMQIDYRTAFDIPKEGNN